VTTWDDVLMELKLIRAEAEEISGSELPGGEISARFWEMYQRMFAIMNAMAGQEIPAEVHCEALDVQVITLGEIARVLREIRVSNYGPSPGFNLHVEP
jgi:hypothetical protein